MNILQILLSTLILVKYCAGSESSFQWTSHLEDALQTIYEHANASKDNLKQRMKDEWDRLFPMYSHLDSDYLWQYAQSLAKMSEIRNIKRKGIQNFKWEPKYRSELVKIYKNTDTGAKNHSGRIYDEWVERHQELSYMDPHYLIDKTQDFMNESRRRKKEQRVSYEWTKELDDKLMETALEGSVDYKSLHQKWISEHTEFRTMTSEQLRQRVYYLKKQRKLNERLKRKEPIVEPEWTQNHDKKLVKIYFEKKGRAVKIHKKFIEDNPEFDFIMPKQLLQRAWYMVRHGNMTDANKAVDSLPRVRPHRETYNFLDRDVQEPLVNPEQYMIHRVHLNTPRLSMEHSKRSHNDYYSTADRANWGADLTLGRDSWTHHYGVDQEYGEGTSSQHNTFKPNCDSESYNTSTSYRRHE